jgi:hypothetical protein
MHGRRGQSSSDVFGSSRLCLLEHVAQVGEDDSDICQNAQDNKLLTLSLSRRAEALIKSSANLPVL